MLQLDLQPQQEIVVVDTSVCKVQPQLHQLEVQMLIDVQSVTIALQELLFKFHVIQDIIVLQLVLRHHQVLVMQVTTVDLKVHQLKLRHAQLVVIVLQELVFQSHVQEELIHQLLKILNFQIASIVLLVDTVRILDLLPLLDLVPVVIIALEVISCKDHQLKLVREVKDVLLKVQLLKLAQETIKIEHFKEFAKLVQQDSTVLQMEHQNLIRKLHVTRQLLFSEHLNHTIVQIML